MCYVMQNDKVKTLAQAKQDASKSHKHGTYEREGEVNGRKWNGDEKQEKVKCEGNKGRVRGKRWEKVEKMGCLNRGKGMEVGGWKREGGMEWKRESRWGMMVDDERFKGVSDGNRVWLEG